MSILIAAASGGASAKRHQAASGGGGAVFSDEFDSLSLDDAGNGANRWATWFVGWDSRALTGNSDDCWKGGPSYVGSGGSTLSQLGLSCHAQGTSSIILYGRQIPSGNQAQFYNYLYVGGMITSELSHYRTYGVWDVRGRFAPTKGIHWSLWMVPKSGEWPPEVDIVEILNNNGQYYQGAHGKPLDVYLLGAGVGYDAVTPPKWTATDYAGWHTFRFIWTATTMEWWVDGVFKLATPNFVNQDMYIMVTPEISGNWEGAPDGTTVWPTTAEIDWVRVYLPPEHLAPTSRVAGGTNLRDSASNSPPSVMADIDENATQDDGVWWTAVDTTVGLDVRVRLGTPASAPVGNQLIRALVRKTAGTGYPDLTAELWQNGSKLTSTATASVTTSQIVSLTFPASELTTASGANTEVRLVAAAAVAGTVFSESWTAANGTAWDNVRWPEQGVNGTSVIDVQGNAGHMIAQGAAFAHARARASATISDFEMTMTATMAGTGEQYHSIFVRASTAFTGNNPTNCYRFMIQDGAILYTKYSGGTASGTQTVNRTWGTSPWNIRIKCAGSAVQCRIWQGTEPGTWDFDITDTSFTSGALTIQCLNGASAGTPRTVTWDTIVVNVVGSAATVEVGAVEWMCFPYTVGT